MKIRNDDIEAGAYLKKFDLLNRRILPQNVLRIIDQTSFEGGNDGGCQFASLFSAIEAKFGKKIDKDDMRVCYELADEYWGGKTEKLSRAIRYLRDVGFEFSGIGFVKAKNYFSMQSIERDFELLYKGTQRFDYAGIAFKRSSGFFSDTTGRFNDAIRLPQTHVCRLLAKYPEELTVVNSWIYQGGRIWGDHGMGHLNQQDFGTIKIEEIRLCDFYISKLI